MTTTDTNISTAKPTLIVRKTGETMGSIAQMRSGMHYKLEFEQNEEYELNGDGEEVKQCSCVILRRVNTLPCPFRGCSVNTNHKGNLRQLLLTHVSHSA